MSTPRRHPARAAATAAAAASVMLLLAACSGADEGENAAPSPTTASATAAPSATDASASATPSTTDDASATATPSGDAVAPDDVQETVEPVTGPADMVAPLFYIPASSDSLNACQLLEGEMFCVFFDQQLDQTCSAEEPYVLATFTGTETVLSCSAGGDASQSGTVAIGEVAGDPALGFLCEGVEGGVRCTSSATGRTALLTATQVGMLD